MIAEKANKIYMIDSSLMEQYRTDGFDIKNDNGEIIAYGKGKKVAYDEYAALKKENAELKKELVKKKAGKQNGV